MRLIDRFLIVLMLGVLFVGCASKEKKETANTSSTSVTSAPKSFERPIPPVMMTNPRDRADYLTTRYWNNFDYTDTMYCHSEFTEQAFSEFIYIVSLASYGKVSEGVKKLLDSAEVNEVMYNYFYKQGEKYLYDPNSPTRNDEFFIPFLEHIVTSSKVMEESKIRPRLLLQLAYRNRVGSRAEDIVYTTESGRSGRLYTISARYILLMFYNPDCMECQLTTNELKSSSVITSAVSSGRLKVLAVYPDENMDIWRNHLNDFPSSWINGYDKSLVIRTNQTYDLKAIPTLYLLDENKHVILKDTSVGHLHDYLEQNQ